MIGGKPITVQMPAGNQRTLTLVGNQVTGTVGKLVCLPNSTVATAVSEQPKLMVLSRQRQPSATIASASFDSPATTDAALAALAAEAGLIDPEASNKFESDGQSSFPDSGVASMPSSQVSDSQPETDNSDVPMELGTEQNAAQDDSYPEETLENLEMEVNSGGVEQTNSASLEGQNSVVGLFGGSNKLGLKGGGRFKLGLLGGSPITFPKKPFMWRKGLLGGGNGDSETTTNPQIGTNIFQNTTESVNFSEAPANNFSNSSDTNIDNPLTLDIKNEYEDDEFKLQYQDDETPKSSEFNATEGLIKEEFADRIKREMSEGPDAINGSNSDFEGLKKEDGVGDALSTLASAALGRATPQTYTKSDTVSFILLNKMVKVRFKYLKISVMLFFF